MKTTKIPDIDTDQLTKKQILVESVKLFSRQGFNGASMRDIAKAVGITPGALYYYFPNKKELHFSAVVYAYRERSTPAVDVFSAPDESNLMLVLEKFLLRLCNRFYKDEDFRRMVQWILLDSENDPELRKIITKVVYEKHYDALTHFLEKMAPDCDPYRLTIFIYGLVIQNYSTRGIRKHRKSSYNEAKEKPEAVTREIMALLQNGIFKRDES